MNQSLPAPLDVKLMNLTASVLFLGCVLLLLAALYAGSLLGRDSD